MHSAIPCGTGPDLLGRTSLLSKLATQTAPDRAPALWLGGLATICVVHLVLVLVAERGRPFVGSPDQAAYVHQAEQLLACEGARVDYVQHFYRAYDSVSHPEDHYGIGQGALIAASFAVFGDSDWAATVPSALAGCLLLPLAVFLAARALGAVPVWAFAAGIVAGLDREVFGQSRMALCDAQFAALALLAWCAAQAASPRAAGWRSHAPALCAGALLAAAWWLKPGALLLGPGVLATAWLASEREGRLARVGVLLAAFVILAGPWLLRNALLFGSPLYTANSHIGPAVNWTDNVYTASFRKVWWATGEVPWGYTDLPARVGWPRIGEVVGERLRDCLLGSRADPHVWAIWLGFAGGLLPLGEASRHRRRIGIALLALSYVVALCLLLPPHARYRMVVPAAAAAVWAALAADALARVGSRLPRWAGAALAGAALLALCWSPARLEARALSSPPRTLRAAPRATRDAALWAREALAGSGPVMTNDCWVFVRYAGLPTVNVPQDTPEAIASVVEHYGVASLVLIPEGTYGETSDWARAYLASYADEWQPQVDCPEGVEVYRRTRAP